MVVSQSRICVLLVEDDSMARAGLEFFVEAYPELQLIGQVTSGEEAVEFCEHADPDVVVMDIKLPGIDGIDAMARIRRAKPSVQVVALSSFHDQALVERALSAGASSYVHKSSPARDLLDAIRSAYAAKAPRV